MNVFDTLKNGIINKHYNLKSMTFYWILTALLYAPVHCCIILGSCLEEKNCAKYAFPSITKTRQVKIITKKVTALRYFFTAITLVTNSSQYKLIINILLLKGYIRFNFKLFNLLLHLDCQ